MFNLCPSSKYLFSFFFCLVEPFFLKIYIQVPFQYASPYHPPCGYEVQAETTYSYSLQYSALSSNLFNISVVQLSRLVRCFFELSSVNHQKSFGSYMPPLIRGQVRGGLRSSGATTPKHLHLSSKGIDHRCIAVTGSHICLKIHTYASAVSLRHAVEMKS